MSLAALLAGAEPRDGGLALDIPEDWHQGRTAYGGLSSALALAVAQRVGGALPPLRSAQVSFVGPLSGTVALRATVLRRGRNATWMRAEILRDEAVGLTANFVFMGPVPSVVHLDARRLPDDVIPPDRAVAVPSDRAPTFLRSHFDTRFALPPVDGPRTEASWWVRLREREGLDPMVHLLACADAPPPGVLPLAPRETPLSSMTWQCNLLDPAPVTADGWWLLHTKSDFAVDGGVNEVTDIWSAAGLPVMASIQSVALFG